MKLLHILLSYSTESGWDNPFRPGGDLSREADEIVNMIKGKKNLLINFRRSEKKISQLKTLPK